MSEACSLIISQNWGQGGGMSLKLILYRKETAAIWAKPNTFMQIGCLYNYI